MLFGEIIYRLAAENAEAPMMVDSHGAWNRSQVKARVDHLIGKLSEIGFTKGDRLVLMYGKSRYSVALSIACLKLGVVFVPLDWNMPKARLEFILRSVEPKLIVGHDVFRKGDFSVVSLEELIAQSNDELGVRKPFPENVCAEDPAYCMFTSGSTGKPKGVVISHGSLASFCKNLQGAFPLGQNSSFLSLGPFFFDISVVDMLYPLSQGARVRLYDEKFPLQRRILSIIEEESITHFCAVTALLTLLSENESEFRRANLASLRQIMTGGEAPAKALIKKWKNGIPGISVLNGYGPTEFTCTCIVHDISSNDLKPGGDIPIGYPIPEVDTLILGDVGPAVSGRGELLLGGPQCLSTYWKADDEFDRRTLLIDGKRYYRTGDIVHREGTDSFIYIGRTNDEVKVSGYRINLGDIRLHLEKEFDYEEYVLCVVKDNLSRTSLCLCINHSSLDAEIAKNIRRSIGEVFPKYYVPALIAKTCGMPFLAGGKIDRTALVRKVEEFVSADSDHFIEISFDVQIQESM